MSKFTMTGRVVTHATRPRFRMLFSKSDISGWDGEPIEWIDSMPKDAIALARLMREAGDFFAANMHADWLQERVIARAAKLGLTSYAIAKATGNAVSEDHVRDYLTRSKSMGSHKLQHVLRVLNLDLIEND